MFKRRDVLRLGAAGRGIVSHAAIGARPGHRRLSVEADHAARGLATRRVPTSGTAALAEAMSKLLGQPVVVDNKAGASGTLAPAALVTAKPDGYTIAHMPITVLRLPVMQKVAFDPLKDFTWIVHMSGFQFVTMVRADSPIKTMQELIEYARANPGKVTYGSPGTGTSLHIGMELIAKHAGVKFTHVPFKGTIETVTNLEGGHVMAVAGGSLKPIRSSRPARSALLAVWTAKRLPGHARCADADGGRALPFVFDSPYGMAGPKGMDPAIVKILHDAIKTAMEDPKTIGVRNKFNMVDAYMDTAAYAKFQVELFAKEKQYLTDLGLAKKD